MHTIQLLQFAMFYAAGGISVAAIVYFRSIPRYPALGEKTLAQREERARMYGAIHNPKNFRATK